jgi:O-antigen/teichoic acid export membrane protein
MQSEFMRALSSMNKILLNTSVLYAKLLISMIVAFITSRLVLNALGTIDYGINSIVAGVIGLLAFLQSTISSASIIFLAHSLGSDDIQILKRTFNSTLLVHIIFGFAIVIIIECGGLVMFNGILNIPEGRLHDAWIVFHLMAITTFISIISVPYDAVINAHEDFLPFSIIDTIGVLVSLVIAYVITKISNNLMVVYAILTALNQLLLRLIKQLYCNHKYSECKVQIIQYSDKSIVKNILNFAGWKTLDAGASVLYSQLKGIILNVFFGVILNAANGIASNLTMQVNNFSSNLTTAINPQIIKSEGSGDRNRMIELTKSSAKFSVFLFAIFSIPILLETDFLLLVWLKNVPVFTSLFIRLIIIEMLIQKFTHPLITAIQAIGKIRGITLVVLVNIILQLTLTYYLYKSGYSASAIYVVSIFGSIISFVTRLYFGKKLLNLNIMLYFRDVIFKALLPISISGLVSIIPLIYLHASMERLLCVTFVSTVSHIITIRFFGLSNLELARIKEAFFSFKNR